jgi:hypothetical protein
MRAVGIEWVLALVVGLLGWGGVLWAQNPPQLRGKGLDRILVYEDGDSDGRVGDVWASATVEWLLNLENGQVGLRVLSGRRDGDTSIVVFSEVTPWYPVAVDGERLSGGLSTLQLRYEALFPLSGPVQMRIIRWPETYPRAAALAIRVEADVYGLFQLRYAIRDTVDQVTLYDDVVLEVRCRSDGPPRLRGPILLLKNTPSGEFDLTSLVTDPDGTPEWLPVVEGNVVGPNQRIQAFLVGDGADPFFGMSSTGELAGLYWDAARARLRLVPAAWGAHWGNSYSRVRIGVRNACPADTEQVEVLVRVEPVNTPPWVSSGEALFPLPTGGQYFAYDNRPMPLLGERTLTEGDERLWVWHLDDVLRSTEALRPPAARTGQNTGAGQAVRSLFFDVETPTGRAEADLTYRLRLERRLPGRTEVVADGVERVLLGGSFFEVDNQANEVRFRFAPDFHTDFDCDGRLDTLLLVVRAFDDGRAIGTEGIRDGIGVPARDQRYDRLLWADYGLPIMVRPRPRAPERISAAITDTLRFLRGQFEGRARVHPLEGIRAVPGGGAIGDGNDRLLSRPWYRIPTCGDRPFMRVRRTRVLTTGGLGYLQPGGSGEALFEELIVRSDTLWIRLRPYVYELMRFAPPSGFGDLPGQNIRLWLELEALGNTGLAGEPITVVLELINSGSSTGVVEEPPEEGLELRLYPNPAASRVRLEGRSQEREVRVEIYTLLGQRMAVLSLRPDAGGDFAAWIEVASWPAGWYLVRVRAGKQEHLRPLLVRSGSGR